MPTNKYPNNNDDAGGAVVVAPRRPPGNRGSGRILGTGGSVNNPTPGNPGQTGGNQFTGSGGPLGNPNYPCIAGPEILPLASTTVPVDLGTRYDFKHHLPVGSYGMQRGQATANFEMAAARQQHAVAFDLYRTGNELTNDEVTTVTLHLRRVDLGPTAVVIGGGTAFTAINNPGGAYVEMDASLANSWVACWFDTSTLTTNYSNARVVRVGIRYLAWKDDSATATPGEGFSILQWDTVMSASGFEYGNWLTNDYQRNAQYQTRWLGETNFLTRGQAVTTEHNREPWTVVDLAHQAALDETMFFEILGQQGYDSSQSTVYLDYIEMIVEVVPERRVAVGTRIVSNLIDDATHDYGYEAYLFVEWRYAFDTSLLVQLTSSDYTLTVREAIPADSSDRYRAAPIGAFLWAYPEALGPSLQLLGITQTRPTQYPQLETLIGTISDGVLVGQPQPFDDYNLSVSHYDSLTLSVSGAFWASYVSLGSLTILMVSDAGADIMPILVDGLTTYTRVKILAQPDELTPSNLDITVSQFGVSLATATVTPAAVRALPDVGGGWREFELILSSPVTPASGLVLVTASSTTPSIAPWLVSAALSTGYQLGVVGIMFSYFYDATAVDVAMVLVCEPVVPPAPTAVETISEVVAGAACGIDNIRYYRLTWATEPGATRYEVQRRLTGSTDWTTAAVVDNTYPTGATYFDLATPWDVGVDYRIGSYRESDQVIVYGPITSAAALPSQGATYGLSDTDNNVMIYVPTTDAGSLSTGWTDLNKTELVQLLGEDFNRALQAPEDRGLSFSTQVLIADLFVCTGSTVNPLTVGQRSLSPAPYDLIRAFSRRPYVNVRFPGGMVRQMVLQLGGLTVRNQFGVYLTDIVLTDAFVPGLDVTQDPTP